MLHFASKILRFIDDSGSASTSEIARSINASERSVRYHLSKMRKKGLLVEDINLNDMRIKRYKRCNALKYLFVGLAEWLCIRLQTGRRGFESRARLN